MNNMEIWEHVFLPLIGAAVGILASSGFWGWVIFRGTVSKEQSAATKARDDMILGLGHDRIMYLSEKYIALGEITADEYENLHAYLFEPYVKMGGNGGAKRNMEKVYRLEVKRSRSEQRDIKETEKRNHSSNAELKEEKNENTNR